MSSTQTAARASLAKDKPRAATKLKKAAPAPKVAKPVATGTSRSLPVPTSGATWEDSRSTRLANMKVGEIESFTKIIGDDRGTRAVGLDEMVALARVNMNGSVGKAMQRASKLTGNSYRLSISVHLLQSPTRMAMTCVVERDA